MANNDPFGVRDGVVSPLYRFLTRSDANKRLNYLPSIRYSI